MEVVVAAQLSGDEILRQEIIDEVDIHEGNRARFKLGGNVAYDGESDAEKAARKAGRLVAKIFKFRLIYGGSAYSYANDSAFQSVSASEKFWQNVIDQYYDKYRGIQRWHTELINTAQRDGKLEIPSGRFYPITPNYMKREPWPLTIIKNYPVQGFGADLVMLARLEAAKRLREAEIEALLISTIHDSIVADTPAKNVEVVGRILDDSIRAVPDLCRKVFDYDFSLPLTSEVQFGMNKKQMQDLTLH